MKNTFPSFNEAFERLQPQLPELDRQRKLSRQKEAKNMVLPIIGLIMVVIGLYFFEVEEIEWDPIYERGTRKPDLLMLGLMLTGLVLFIQAFIFSSGRSLDYKDAYKDQLVGAFVEAIDPTFIGRPRSFIEKITFMRANFFPHELINVYSGKNLIQGKRGSTDFRFSEVKIKKDYNHTSGIIFKGLFFEADFHKHFKGRTIVKPRKRLDMLPFYRKRIRHIDAERISMEDVDFNRKFTVFSDDPVEARYLLSMSLMDDLISLRNRLNCKMYISFIGDNMYLAIKWKKKLFSRYWKLSANDEDLIYQYYEDLIFCLGLIDDLNLNTRIWSK